MHDVIIFLTLAVLAGQSLGQNPDGSWNVGHYPDPILYPGACGRSASSFVCDPQNTLPLDKVNLIDSLLKTIYNETNSGCYSVNPEKRGWLVMMAVVPRMEKYFTRNMADSMHQRFKEAVSFSYFLSTPLKWGNYSNNCDEMAVIVYAVHENVVFTMTRPRIRTVLTDSKMNDITWDAVTRYPSFYRTPARAANAITFMARQYKTLLKTKRTTG